jgi:hypothetical protein
MLKDEAKKKINYPPKLQNRNQKNDMKKKKSRRKMKSEKKILKIISNKTSINQKNGDQI